METKLYPGIAFSPQAALADGVGARDTVIPVSDVSAFPDGPNLATIGTDEGGETVLYAAKTDTALAGCVRGVEGAAKAWSAGEPVGRNWTAKDHNDLIAAVLAVRAAAQKAAQEAQEAQDMAAAHQKDRSAHSALFAALEAKYGRRVVAVRVRDPSRPDYGLEDGGEAAVALEAEPYTGTAEVTAIVSSVEYDAKNMSASGESVPDGTLILRKVEE